MLLAKRRRQEFGTAYLGEQALDEWLLTKVKWRDGPMVIKAHEVGPVALQWIDTGRAKAVCTIRDPRDCVASDIPFWGKGFDASVQRIMISLKSLQKPNQDFGRTLFVRYEEMMGDRLRQIERIAAYLHVEIGQRELEWIDGQTSIQSCKKVCQGLNERPGNQVQVEPTGHRRDPITLLHDNHIGTAKVGRWKQDLTDAQTEQLTRLFANILQTLGYETQQSIQPYLANTTGAATNAGRSAANDSPASQPMA